MGRQSHVGTARSQAASSVKLLVFLVFNLGIAIELFGELLKSTEA